MGNPNEQTKNLLEKAEILNKSILDWEKRMLAWGNRADTLPSDRSLEDLKVLERELSTLIARGEMEIKNLENWEQERIKLWQKKN